MDKETTIRETKDHIDLVAKNLGILNKEILKRSFCHDNSKLSNEELPYFQKYTGILKKLTYGSDEYKKALDGLKPALKHHYEINSHHPEHYENGVDDMTLIDIIEMFSDQCAATKRHEDGDIFKSIDINEKRFKMSPQLCKIFKNTLKKIKGLEFNTQSEN